VNHKYCLHTWQYVWFGMGPSVPFSRDVISSNPFRHTAYSHPILRIFLHPSFVY
jgi:hypothetical protein